MMKKIVKLQTTKGLEILVTLENWGSGLDALMCRWTAEGGCWHCTDTGELAQESRLVGLQVFSGRNPVLQLLP